MNTIIIYPAKGLVYYCYDKFVFKLCIYNIKKVDDNMYSCKSGSNTFLV